MLEAGTYEIKLMANAHHVIDSREYVVDQTVTYGEGNPRSGDLTAAVNRFEDVSTGQITQYVSRADWEGTTPKAREDGKTASDSTVSALTAGAVYDSDPNAPAITFASNGLTLEDMAGLDYDDPKWEKLLEQLSVEDMTKMISNGGWSTPEVASVGKPATNDLDGPAGINSLVSDLKGVAYPSEALIGASWNQELLESFGHTFGAEAAANHVVGLYAPAVNIHRTPYSGRNFEYYSEDALLSGKLGAAMVRGYASQGVYAYVKHFALNDQESNRLSISVWSNEQAMRELYLKAFEVVQNHRHDEQLQLPGRNLGGSQPGPAHRGSAGRVGLPGHRGHRLRHGQYQLDGHQPGPAGRGRHDAVPHGCEPGQQHRHRPAGDASGLPQHPLHPGQQRRRSRRGHLSLLAGTAGGAGYCRDRRRPVRVPGADHAQGKAEYWR